MDMKPLLFAATWLLLAMPGHAGGEAETDWTRAFDAANAAYEAGQHQEALDQYEALLEEVSHFSSEFNAGNAAYKLGKLGVARLHYERASLLDPGHAGLEANMALLESKIVDRIADVPTLGLKDWLRSWLGAEQLRGWLLWALIYWCLAWGLWMARWRKTRPASRSTVGFLGAGSMVLACIGLAGAYASHKRIQAPQRVVVMVDRTDVRSTPSSSGTVLFQLHEGAAACLLHDTEGWREIELDNGNVGWISRDAVEDV